MIYAIDIMNIKYQNLLFSCQIKTLKHFGVTLYAMSSWQYFGGNFFDYVYYKIKKKCVMKEDDKITETRNSHDTQQSCWLRLKNLLCPCFKFTYYDSEHNHSFSKADETNDSYIKKKTIQFNQEIKLKRRNSLQSREIKQSLVKSSFYNDRSYRQSVNIQSQNTRYGNCIDEIDCSICNFTENHLISIGIKTKHLLVKVSTVRINLSIQLLKKEMRNLSKKIQNRDSMEYPNFQFNKFWHQRYILFEKFDEGIKIDERSWSKILPQQVSQYIASKCNGAKVILQAFAGVGGNTIKLANINSISQIIANDYNLKKMDFLLNNLKVYQVDNKVQLSNVDFLKLQIKNIDVVVVKPPIRNLIRHRNISITDFNPSLDKIISKSMKLSDNIIMILPPETNIDALCSCLNTCASELRKMKTHSSIKIEKIYNEKQIRCIMVLIGPLVQTQIKLNDELQYIYKKLRKSGERYFKHKKILKKIRQECGMLNLFNYIKECQALKKEYSKNHPQKEYFLIDIFYDFIINQKIISKEKTNKIIEEQNAQFQRQSSYHMSMSPYFEQPFEYFGSPIMEQQKMSQDSYEMTKQLTQSDYSYYSNSSGIQKKSSMRSNGSSFRYVREKGQKSNGSIIIKRQEHQLQCSNSPTMQKKIITEVSQEEPSVCRDSEK